MTIFSWNFVANPNGNQSYHSFWWKIGLSSLKYNLKLASCWENTSLRADTRLEESWEPSINQCFVANPKGNQSYHCFWWKIGIFSLKSSLKLAFVEKTAYWELTLDWKRVENPQSLCFAENPKGNQTYQRFKSKTGLYFLKSSLKLVSCWENSLLRADTRLEESWEPSITQCLAENPYGNQTYPRFGWKIGSCKWQGKICSSPFWTKIV